MSLGAFLRDRVVLGPTLAVPVRVLWWDYLDYCGTWGFESCTAAHFVVEICRDGAVHLHVGGTGRLRRYFHGVGAVAGSTEGRDRAA